MSPRLRFGVRTFAALGALLVPAASVAADVYQYDAVGRLVRVVYQDGPTNDYAYDNNGNLLSVTSIPVSVAERPAPAGFALGPSFPVPASEVSRVRFSIPRRERVSLRVHDMGGRRVATLVDGWREAGHHEVEFRTVGHAAGVYVYRLRAGGMAQSRRFVVVR